MQSGSGTRDVDMEHIVGDVEDQRLREELRSYQHLLVNAELERARHSIQKCYRKSQRRICRQKKLITSSTI